MGFLKNRQKVNQTIFVELTDIFAHIVYNRLFLPLFGRNMLDTQACFPYDASVMSRGAHAGTLYRKYYIKGGYRHNECRKRTDSFNKRE